MAANDRVAAAHGEAAIDAVKITRFVTHKATWREFLLPPVLAAAEAALPREAWRTPGMKRRHAVFLRRIR